MCLSSGWGLYTLDEVEKYHVSNKEKGSHCSYEKPVWLDSWMN